MNTNATHEREPWMEAVIDAFDRIDPPPRPDDQELIEQLQAADAEPVEWGPFPIWRHLGKTTVRRFAYAAAAILLIAAVLTGVFLPGGMSPQQAFAQVISNVARMRTAVMDVIVSGRDQQEYRLKMYLKNPGYMRQEFHAPDLVVTVYDFDNQKLLTMLPDHQRASLTDLAEFPESFNIVDGFENLQAENATLVDQITENDRTLMVYDVEQEGVSWRVWTDKQTLLPVRMHVRSTLRGAADVSEMHFENMQWDVALDESMFAMTPPEGFALTSDGIGAPGPDDLLRMLRLWTHLSDGSFPDEFHHMSLYRLSDQFQQFEQRLQQSGEDQAAAWGEVAVLIGLDVTKLGPDDDAAFTQKITEVAGRCASYLAVLAQQPNEWHWTGRGARLGDPDRIVCYWKTPDDDQYLAIDAQLNLVQLAADQLPAPQPDAISDDRATP